MTRWALMHDGAVVDVIEAPAGAPPFETHPDLLWIDVGGADVKHGARWDGHEFRNPDDPRGPPAERRDPRNDRALLAQGEPEP